MFLNCSWYVAKSVSDPTAIEIAIINDKRMMILKFRQLCRLLIMLGMRERFKILAIINGKKINFNKLINSIAQSILSVSLKNKKVKNGIVTIDKRLDVITIVSDNDVRPFIISVNTADDTPAGSAARKKMPMCNAGSKFLHAKKAIVGKPISFTMFMQRIVDGFLMWVTMSITSTFKNKSPIIIMII